MILDTVWFTINLSDEGFQSLLCSDKLQFYGKETHKMHMAILNYLVKHKKLMKDIDTNILKSVKNKKSLKFIDLTPSITPVSEPPAKRSKTVSANAYADTETEDEDDDPFAEIIYVRWKIRILLRRLSSFLKENKETFKIATNKYLSCKPEFHVRPMAPATGKLKLTCGYQFDPEMTGPPKEPEKKGVYQPYPTFSMLTVLDLQRTVSTIVGGKGRAFSKPFNPVFVPDLDFIGGDGSLGSKA